MAYFKNNHGLGCCFLFAVVVLFFVVVVVFVYLGCFFRVLLNFVCFVFVVFCLFGFLGVFFGGLGFLF